MFFLVLRLAPWLLAGFAALVSWWQWRTPSIYPWPLVLVLVGYVVSAGSLVWQSKHWREGLWALWPTCIAIVAIGFGHLLIEDPVFRFLTTMVFSFIPWLALRLGWLLLYEPGHYPPQAFFRFHLALAPVCFWYVFSTLQGIQVFLLPTDGLVSTVAFLFQMVLLAGTVRSWKDARERRWFWTSLVVSVHVLLLLAVLPTTMAVQGTFAALLVAVPLRLRQISQEGKRPLRRLWMEVAAFVVVWGGICVSARWA